MLGIWEFPSTGVVDCADRLLTEFICYAFALAYFELLSLSQMKFNYFLSNDYF